MNKPDCEEMRRQIKVIADQLNALRKTEAPPEAIANATLAFRHLEDSAMRLGKAIQVLDGGTSVYDAAQTPKV